MDHLTIRSVINLFLFVRNHSLILRLHRFPGGESYQDVVTRLESIIIEIEQQLAPVVVVSHVSVIQVLLSYFRQTPVDDCTKIEVPMHTVIELRPLLGGGWQEVQHTLIPQDEYSDGTFSDGVVTPETPIWEDRKDRRLMTETKLKVSP
jgi:broad specificity phosphatase PhoE